MGTWHQTSGAGLVLSERRVSYRPPVGTALSILTPFMLNSTSSLISLRTYRRTPRKQLFCLLLCLRGHEASRQALGWCCVRGEFLTAQWDCAVHFRPPFVLNSTSSLISLRTYRRTPRKQPFLSNFCLVCLVCCLCLTTKGATRRGHVASNATRR
jgi:hypothetical protein